MGLALALSISATAEAQANVEKGERCATRLSIALLGKSANAALVSAATPQANVDAMIADPAFVERFSRFVNATFNDAPGATPDQDAAYYMARYILQNNKPWKEMFIGPYDLQVTRNTDGVVTAVTGVIIDPTNTPLGYFNDRGWKERYAGNEPAGIMIATAYRMMHNTLGLRLTASTNKPGADISATGRQAAECRGCHYDSWFALDKTAAILPKVADPAAATITFTEYTGAPQPILGGINIANQRDLAAALVNSEAFRFYACRLSFQFLYGRPESTCEGPIFDACMTEFNAKGTIQSAIAAVAKDATFCQ
jgi:hypothetical protein